MTRNGLSNLTGYVREWGHPRNFEHLHAAMFMGRRARSPLYVSYPFRFPLEDLSNLSCTCACMFVTHIHRNVCVCFYQRSPQPGWVFTLFLSLSLSLPSTRAKGKVAKCQPLQERMKARPGLRVEPPSMDSRKGKHGPDLEGPKKGNVVGHLAVTISQGSQREPKNQNPQGIPCKTTAVGMSVSQIALVGAPIGMTQNDACTK